MNSLCHGAGFAVACDEAKCLLKNLSGQGN
jgi:hypothetical protein